jgi:hypothetical protein
MHFPAQFLDIQSSGIQNGEIGIGPSTMQATVTVRRADTMDDDFSYQFTIEDAASCVLPTVGDYIDVGQNSSRRVVQRDFHYAHDSGASRVDITLFVE